MGQLRTQSSVLLLYAPCASMVTPQIGLRGLFLFLPVSPPHCLKPGQPPPAATAVALIGWPSKALFFVGIVLAWAGRALDWSIQWFPLLIRPFNVCSCFRLGLLRLLIPLAGASSLRGVGPWLDVALCCHGGSRADVLRHWFPRAPANVLLLPGLGRSFGGGLANIWDSRATPPDPPSADNWWSRSS